MLRLCFITNLQLLSILDGAENKCEGNKMCNSDIMKKQDAFTHLLQNICKMFQRPLLNSD